MSESLSSHTARKSFYPELYKTVDLIRKDIEQCKPPSKTFVVR